VLLVFFFVVASRSTGCLCTLSTKSQRSRSFRIQSDIDRIQYQTTKNQR
jgi:hypothetical protein